MSLIVASAVVLLITVSPVQSAGGGSGSGVRVAYSSETGKASFIGTRSGKPVERPAGLSSSAAPAVVARAFLGNFGRSFGIADQARELQTTSTHKAPAGRSVVRFQQVHDGVPVLGGDLVVNLDGSKNLLSIGGEVLPAPAVSVVPSIASSVARETALRAVAKARSVPASKLQASKPSLWIYDSRIMGGPGLGRPTLVWRMDVSGEGAREPIDEFVLVDAQLGMVALQFDQLEKALYRQVCDANNADAQVPCTAPFARIEDDAASAIADVNDAYDHSGETYNFFFDHFVRDSIDGAGMTIKSTTRYCPLGYDCDIASPDYDPFENAYWDGEYEQMVYGQGFASADDVVGHELTHGVTDYTSNLFYYYQSGAINESLSDIFGEFVDQTYGPDNPADKWLMGEDLSGGAGRDMKNPPAFGDPDKMSSSNYAAYTDESVNWDNGGVHTNSGINNKAAYLITDGDTFNGYTVTGLGIAKAAAIYYEAETNLLTSASDYGDLYNDLPQACTNLIGTVGITSADCTQVTNAVNAVEMSGTPAAAPNPEAPVCPSGQSPQDLFSDDFENTASGKWGAWTGTGSNAWGWDTSYATSGITDLWGYDQSVVTDSAAQMTGSVAIPAGSTSYLRFNHAYQFDDLGAGNGYDGGVLEYSTNGGSNWNDAAWLGIDNGYNGTIISSYGNPLGGRSAFVAESNGYISSRVNLSWLDGQSVRFRFRIGTDDSFSDYGWFVDDVRIYTCSVPAVPTFAFTSASYSVGEAGPTASVTINRTGLTTGTDSVHFSSADGTAAAGSDYTAVSQDVSFAPGVTSQTVSVPITDDAVIEGDESVSLSLSGPSAGATIGSPGTAVLIIVDNDRTFAFRAASYSVKESGGVVAITVARTGVTAQADSVHVATANGTASAGSDYTAVSQTVSFAAGEYYKTVNVPITNDKRLEGRETFRLALSSPSAGAQLISPSTTTITITNSPGRIASARLTKTAFARSQARKVKLTVKFSPASAKFNYVLSFKKGSKWLKVKTVKKTGNFSKRTMTVKSLFGGKAVKLGRYRVKLTADANSKTLAFKVK